MESALRTVPVAHQFLQSPCDVPQLLAAIERAGSVTAALPDATIRRIVGAVGELPCLPRTAAALMRALEDPEVPVSRLAGIVEQDIAISAKVMQLVNSAFFGRSQRVTTIPHAVTLLGIDVLKQLVITAEIFRAFRPQRFIRGYRLDCIQEHSHVVAAIAAHLPLPGTAIPVAAVAALLHDAGKLIMASRLPLECERVGRLTTAGAISFHAAEARVMGTTHAEIGAYLLALWGLPAEIVDAVARHHRPAVEPGEALLFGAPAAVYFANCLAHERDLASPASASHTAPAIDLDYLRAVGMEDEIVGWRAMAETAGRP
jgi:putative nucleotidyltransferase with HDIG domain